MRRLRCFGVFAPQHDDDFFTASERSEGSQNTQLELLLPGIVARREDFLQNWCILSVACGADFSPRRRDESRPTFFFSASERSEGFGLRAKGRARILRYTQDDGSPHRGNLIFGFSSRCRNRTAIFPTRPA